MSTDCGTSAESVSCLSGYCSTVTGSSDAAAAGFAVDNGHWPAGVSLSQSKSSMAQLDSRSGLFNARDSAESSSFAPARPNVTDWRSKPSVDVPPSTSASASDPLNMPMSRSVECVVMI